jgi:uncharacterized protein
MLARLGKNLGEVMGRPETLKGISAREYIDDKFGLPTVQDILTELAKPGRDPRPEFKTATFQEGIDSLADLQPDMILEGVVTNVAAFGAFVDIGVHQDGLVHISALANKFVKDPHEIVKPGQIVKVKVLEVDVKRQRIALTMRLNDPTGAPPRLGDARLENNQNMPQKSQERRSAEAKCAPTRPQQPIGAIALALAQAKLKK